MTAPTLPPADHRARRDRLRDVVTERGVDLLAVTGASNVRYLSGFTGSHGIVLVSAAGDVLVTDARYDERAAVEAPGLPRRLARDWLDVALDLVEEGGTIGFEGDHVSFARGSAVRDRVVGAGRGAEATRGLVETARQVKDEHEIAAIRAACAITSTAVEHLFGALRPGRTERDVARELLGLFDDLGADGQAFPPIVAGGPHSAIPHHEPGDRPFARGDLVKLDVGATVAGYRSDMTRTVALGDPADDLVAVHALVAAAQAAGLAAARASVDYADVDRAARDVIVAGGHGDHFTHPIGHGVGLDIHEEPLVGSDGAGTLAPGTVLTVEPGVYLPGHGGVRIEDTSVVTADGPAAPLTTAPRELLRL